MGILKAVTGVVVAVMLGALLFIYSGIYNVAADVPHTAAVRWVLETARTQSIDRRDDSIEMPDNLKSMQRIESGAKPYASMCQVCHLGPGIEPTPTHIGLNPQPPRLTKETGHHSPKNLFWIVKHGIKMTGMPAWGETHNDQELWDIVAFIQKLPELSPEQYKQLTGNAGASSEDDHGHSHGHKPDAAAHPH